MDEWDWSIFFKTCICDIQWHVQLRDLHHHHIIIIIIITTIYLYGAYSLKVHKRFTLIKKLKISLKNIYNLNKISESWDQSLTYVHKKVCLSIHQDISCASFIYWFIDLFIFKKEQFYSGKFPTGFLKFVKTI